MEQCQSRSSTGATLNLYSIEPTAPPIAIVQINHGLAEHAFRYRAFMMALAEAGFAAVAHDHRGHGYTTADDAPLGVFARRNGQGAVIEDTLYVQAWARRRWPDVPLIGFGHSMGALVVLNAAVTSPDHLDGLAVWNANATPGLLGRIAQWVNAVERLFSSPLATAKIITALSFGAWDKIYVDDGGPFHWLSRQPDEVEAYIDDPLCGFALSNSIWKDALQMAQVGEDKRALSTLKGKMPVHLLAGAADPATEFGKSPAKLAERLEAVGLTNITQVIIENGRHETLKDLDRKAATMGFISWATNAVVHRSSA